MALAGSAAAPAVGAPPAPRLQRPAPAQRPPTCAAAHPHVRTIAAGQPGWRASGGGGVAAAAPRRRLQQPRRAARLAARAAGGGGQGPWGERQQRKLDNQILLGAGLGLTLLVLVALKLGAVEGADAWQLGAGDVSFGAGDAFGGALWGASLYFTSPIQVGWWMLVLLPVGRCCSLCRRRPCITCTSLTPSPSPSHLAAAPAALLRLHRNRAPLRLGVAPAGSGGGPRCGRP